jgi:hypothetical protein
MNDVLSFAKVLSLMVLFSACAKKVEDYSSLVHSYKTVCCKTLSSSRITLNERKRVVQEKIKLEQDFKDALRHLKQDGKEQLTKNWTRVSIEAANGHCK